MHSINKYGRGRTASTATTSSWPCSSTSKGTATTCTTSTTTYRSKSTCPTQPIQHVPQLNWSHFKSEFTGKPEGDAETHLLRTNDWMDTHAFQGVKVQRFCFTLVGEARFWTESLRPINVDWLGMKSQFRQQYSKIGNTREQLFHVWQSFHFNENTETLDSYVMCIRQVATL